jgi:hypothetical protein
MRFNGVQRLDLEADKIAIHAFKFDMTQCLQYSTPISKGLCISCFSKPSAQVSELETAAR